MALLQLHDLRKTFGGSVAVERVSCQLERGSISGLIGPNGAGKTTTFNMIAGALAPTAGDIIFAGESITRLPSHQRFHRGIVRTFQIPKEYARLTARENLMVAAPDQPGESLYANWLNSKVAAREREVERRADETLEFLGLSEMAHELAGNLSGGQKKLLELGRTMMTDARLVLLDEPGAGVNPTLMRKIMGIIRSLNEERGITFCVIEHDMEVVGSLCDPIIVMAAGRVLTQGSIAQVRADERVVDAYFGE